MYLCPPLPHDRYIFYRHLEIRTMIEHCRLANFGHSNNLHRCHMKTVQNTPVYFISSVTHYP